MENNLPLPKQLHYLSHPTPSRGASQVARPQTTSQDAQPQTNSQVQRPPGSLQHTQSNAPSQNSSQAMQGISRAPSRNSSQPQNVEDNVELDHDLDEPFAEREVGIQDESGVRNKRGIMRLSDVWNLPPTNRIVVKFNEAFVPIGYEGGLFNRFVATVSRKPHLCPINCLDWHKVPQHYKEACWSIIRSKFLIPENSLVSEAIKRYTLKLLGTRLRDWRCTLKNKYFDEAKTAAQIVATAPPTVNREHFADLVSYWFSDEGKALSLKNKGERNWNEDPHTTGSKSYARHAHELEEDSGFAPSRAQLYITTHTDKDENAVNDIAAANIAKIKELLPNSLEGNSKGRIYWSPNDVYSQAINKKEWSGRVRGCGFGPTPKSSRPTCNEFPRFNVADEEERMRDKQTIHELQGKVQSQAAELSTLKEQMAIVMRHAGLQVRDSCNGSLDQISPQAHQGSSHASHDIEYSD
ncbi:hypothetical protein RHSIM_Rhsim04G0054800 [Rhododendron simsii]|uniref:Transposase, Ptta/En/Spm, plant n=1 Tax=Rhododendron simsii TaxID=118357 RepID=A0A834LQW0_RHOSS|nr:hypothetical protein RHSIM_Rhsim04G0054800 [Rhododendron simsii]